MPKISELRDLFACVSVIGFPPLINFYVPASIIFCVNNDPYFCAQSLVNPLFLGAMWAGIAMVIKRDIKLAAIVGGAITVGIYLFFACDYFIRKNFTKEENPFAESCADIACVTCLGTGVIPTVLGCVANCQIASCCKNT